MKAKFYNLIILVLLFGCSGETEKPDPVSIEDFMGDTGEEVEQVETNNTDTLGVEVTGAVNTFIQNQLSGFDTSAHEEFHPLDRFTFSQRKKVRFKSKVDVAYGSETQVTPRAELYYYTFSDTTKTKNAFYNWLDCFGGECDQVQLNQEMEALKMPPQFTLVYDTTILVLDYRCEDANFDWEPFQDSLIKQFGSDYNYQMNVGCGGPLTWK